jgi:hypothetical protein
MKKLYFFIISSILFFACSKDFLKRYDDRIVGSWYISDINRFGFGGNTNNLPFREGSFIFNNDGSLLYTNAAGDSSSGIWQIEKRSVNGDVIRTLQLTTVDFNTRFVRGEFYDDMDFRSTNHFVAKINTPFRTFVTHFRR